MLHVVSSGTAFDRAASNSGCTDEEFPDGPGPQGAGPEDRLPLAAARPPHPRRRRVGPGGATHPPAV
eukprot:3527411-Pyramimonas_sp.AAC.1